MGQFTGSGAHFFSPLIIFGTDVLIPVAGGFRGGIPMPARAKPPPAPATPTLPPRGQTGQALDKMALGREAAVKR